MMRALLRMAAAALGRLADESESALPGETLDEWAARWFDARRTEHVARERRQYAEIVSPMLGSIPVANLEPQHIRQWVAAQDDLVAEGSMMWGTAHRRWCLLSSMLRDTARSKRADLRVRETAPTTGVRGPDRGTIRLAPFLFPSEFLQLSRCSLVPLEARRLYALAIYMYPRAGELDALRAGDVDIDAGVVHVHRSVGRDGRIKTTKTGEHREFVIEPNLLPLMRSIVGRAGSGAGHLVKIRRADAAGKLREHLDLAGCHRDDLTADDEARRPITFHGLRATGITWCAMRGDPITDIAERVGHRQVATTQMYVRRGRQLAELRGEQPFPPIPECLL